jgi:hypothetical protein
MNRSEAERLAKALTDGVMCDGFHGYSSNESDDPQEALRALEIIGAARPSEIVRRAFARSPGGSPPTNRDEREALLDSMAIDAFDSDDEAFFAYPDDVFELADRFVAGGQSD